MEITYYEHIMNILNILDYLFNMCVPWEIHFLMVISLHKCWISPWKSSSVLARSIWRSPLLRSNKCVPANCQGTPQARRLSDMMICCLYRTMVSYNPIQCIWFHIYIYRIIILYNVSYGSFHDMTVLYMTQACIYR